MSNTTKFDVLIVYSEKLATSASIKPKISALPFAKGSKNESYNIFYAYFLDICRKNNLTAAFTTSADIIGPGKCKSYWLYNKKWVKVQNLGYSKNIFDKFAPKSKSRKVKRDFLFSSGDVVPFNSPRLFELCFDKQITHNKIVNISIPTVTIKTNNKKGVNEALATLKNKLKKHNTKSDFSNEIILKNRFGAGGINVFKFNKQHLAKIVATVANNKNISFVIQPYIAFDKGFKYQGIKSSTDIRVIFLGQKIVQTYIRIARTNDFRCNEHAGGKLVYLDKKEIPAQIIVKAKKIASHLKIKNSLIALDFIVSNGGNVYLLEANTGPGIDWDLKNTINEGESKKLIKIIVSELRKRITAKKSQNKRTPKTILPSIYPILLTS